ncbi:hypothetical protein [Agrobacterium rosae]|uniref:hypothetical protein n=1 Tax=Agrobacterium rosae TaxID=1972867 RepID=UPI003A80C165
MSFEKKERKRYPSNVQEYSIAVLGRNPQSIKEVFFLTAIIMLTNPFSNFVYASIIALLTLLISVVMNVHPLIPAALSFFLMMIFNTRKRILAKFVLGEKF